MMKICFFILLFLCCFQVIASAQDKARVYGKIETADHKPLESVSVAIENKPDAVVTGPSGIYYFDVPVNTPITLIFFIAGFKTQKQALTLTSNAPYELNIVLESNNYILPQAVISDQKDRIEGITVIDPRKLQELPNGTMNLEALLKTVGAASNNELSSQYSVRGGNYDENLVYVNDFEIYRPFLIRSGQQEGLTFANPDMVSSLKFSAGGFQAKYGDKMASVLDVQYKQPKKFGATASAGLLGQSLTLEGCSPNHRLTLLAGIRNKTNQILLNSQPTKGEYQPVFTDAQLYVTYDLTEKLELHAIANYNQNKFRFVPESAVTSFGLVNQSIRLTVAFDGQEIDQFQTNMGGLSLLYRPTKNLKLKVLSSVFRMNEDETFDIMGQYYIGQVETDVSKPTFNSIKKSLGVGTNHDYARNYLAATVANISHIGSYFYGSSSLNWGLTLQHEFIEDNIKEWHRTDSAGYSLPYSDRAVNLMRYVKTSTELISTRFSGYIQNSFGFSDTTHFKLTTGVRFNYWDLNKQLLISPRVQLTFFPKWKRDVLFRLGTGMYSQPPFYRELRDLDGYVHQNVVLGSDYHFKLWNRKFSLVSEAYYKYMTNIIPYEVDNVRIKYFGTNNAIAYATGVDLRLNGEFVKDAESWISLSYMTTKENLTDDYIKAFINQDGEVISPKISSAIQNKTVVKDTLLYSGWIPRPTDQRINVGVYFSDYLPKHDNFKVHLNMLFGSGLPFGPPDHNRYKDTLRIPPYRRVDVGFSALLLDGKKVKYESRKFAKHFESIWASLELFNLLGVSNTVSYVWVKDLYNITYAVPNYLTGRRVNLKLTFKIN